VTGNPADPDLLADLAEVEREIAARPAGPALEPTLDRIAALTSLLGDPQRACPVILVTGVNGKTSAARMIEALLRGRGLRTGLFTGPPLTGLRDRICLDGEPIDAQRFTGLYEELAPYLAMVDGQQETELTAFEVLTGMAFAAFADAPVDVAVLETGDGGPGDATRVADGVVAVITPVATDQAHPGSTVESVADSLAGVIGPDCVAVLAQQPVGAAEVLLRHAAEVGATVAREGLEFGVLDRDLAVGGQRLELRGLRGDYHDLFLPLFGGHQAGNAACALAAVEAFAGTDSDVDGVVGRPALLDAGWVREAFAGLRSPGHLEVVRRSPLTLVDAAHNPAAMAAVMAAVTEAFAFASLTVVLAVREDSDVPGLLDELEPVADSLVVTPNSAPDSMDVVKLADLAEGVFGPDRVHRAARLDEAIEIAVTLADETGDGDAPGALVPGASGVLITGSMTTAGDARTLLTATRRPVAGPAAAAGEPEETGES